MSARRSFNLEDQARFAALTGDCNPMHVDPLAARRTQFGQPVVHGVHGLLWALDAAAAAGIALGGYRGLSAQFLKPILLGDVVEARAEPAGESLAITLTVDGLVVAKAKLTRAPAGDLREPKHAAGAPRPMRAAAHDLSIEAMADAGGAVAYAAPDVAGAFPHAARALGAAAISGLAASTYLVGMECPGLHSIYSRLLAAFDGAPAGGLVFEAIEADQRLRVVEAAMRAPGVLARMQAFARHPPAQGPSMAEAAALAPAGAFAGQRALIIGGSRGLGAATAKLLAAGGAAVTITYARGAAEAAAVAGDIEAAGGRCAVLCYDALKEPQSQLPEGYAPNAAYYFAASPIGRRKTRAFDAALLREFMRYHVEGFAALALALRARAAGKLALCYPSSTYAERAPKGLGEYAAAKRAAEALIEDLAAAMAATAFVVERLGPVATDQNAGVMPGELADAAAIMAPVVRRMQAALD